MAYIDDWLVLFVFVNFMICPYFVDEKGKFDELVDDKGVKILIDPKALMHVIGTKMDFVDDKIRYVNLVDVSLHVICVDFYRLYKFNMRFILAFLFFFSRSL